LYNHLKKSFHLDDAKQKCKSINENNWLQLYSKSPEYNAFLKYLNLHYRRHIINIHINATKKLLSDNNDILDKLQSSSANERYNILLSHNRINNDIIVEYANNALKDEFNGSIYPVSTT
jgi:hypothetical protein